MATCIPLDSRAVTTNTTSYASNAFTPATNDLLVIIVATSNSVEPTAGGACTDNQGGTYYLAEFSLGSASTSSNYIFIREQLASAVSHTATFTCTGDPAGGCVVLIYGVSGMSRTGSSAVRQKGKEDNQAAGGTPAPAFPASALTENPTIGMVGNDSNPAGLTPPTGWTNPTTPDFDVGYANPTSGGHGVHRDSGFTGTTITWGSTSASAFGDIIVELDTSAAPAGADPFPFVGGGYFPIEG